MRRSAGWAGSPGSGGLCLEIAHGACTAYNHCMQYTIRNIPDYLDATLRDSARRQGRSLNDVAVQALVRGAGLSEAPRRKRDLADLTGSWREDAAFDAALAAQDAVDEELWPMPQKRATKRTASTAPARKRTAA